MSAPNTQGGSPVSTVALKLVMAGSGLALAAFVLQHMVGNLQVFQGRETYNAYAEFMQGLGGIKWAARAGLLGVIGLHIVSSIALTRRNKMARPESYSALKNRKTGLPALLMLEAGIVVLLFVVYHLAHFTLGVVHADAGFDLVDGSRRDLYNHFIRSFSPERWPVVLAYLVANVALAAHLSHGIQSTFKTLGIAVGRWRKPLELVGPAFGLLILLGNCAMPLAVLSGALAEESSQHSPTADTQGADPTTAKEAESR